MNKRVMKHLSGSSSCNLFTSMVIDCQHGHSFIGHIFAGYASFQAVP